MKTIHEQILHWKEKGYNPAPQKIFSDLGLWEEGFSKLYDEFNEKQANRIIVYISMLYDVQSKRVKLNDDRTKTKEETANELFGENDKDGITDNKNETINNAINFYVLTTQDILMNAIFSGYDVYNNDMKKARRDYSDKDMMKTIEGKVVPMTPSEMVAVSINQSKLYLCGIEVLEKTKELEFQYRKDSAVLSEYVKTEIGLDLENTNTHEGRLRSFNRKREMKP